MLVLLKSWCSNNKPELIEFIDTIQEFRKWSKLKSTYIDGILNFINQQQRLYIQASSHLGLKQVGFQVVSKLTKFTY